MNIVLEIKPPVICLITITYLIHLCHTKLFKNYQAKYYLRAKPYLNYFTINTRVIYCQKIFLPIFDN